jgi:archaellum component FlaC
MLKYIHNDDYLVNKEYIIGRNGNEHVENPETLKAIYDNPTDHSYIIDNGYCINFNDNIYGGIEEMNLNSEDDFEFNCVLIYYKIRKAGGNWVTNLYGVLFLEEVSDLNNDGEIGGYIQRYPKFKNGNSWGLKLDLKIDAQPDSQMELRDTLYDDPNGGGVGMQMFTEALMQLNDCAKLFYDVKKENTDIEERLYKLENMVSGVDTVYDLSNDVSILRTKVEMFQPTLNSIEGRMVDIESRMTRLETNLGYLIGDIKLYKTRMLDIENNVKSVDDKVGDLKPNIEIIDGDSLTITI